MKNKSEYVINPIVTWEGYIRYEVHFSGHVFGDFRTQEEAEEFLFNSIKYKDEPDYLGEKD